MTQEQKNKSKRRFTLKKIVVLTALLSSTLYFAAQYVNYYVWLIIDANIFYSVPYMLGWVLGVLLASTFYACAVTSMLLVFGRIWQDKPITKKEEEVE